MEATGHTLAGQKPRRHGWIRGVLWVALLASLPARARTVLVVGPHPDDETMIAAGRIDQAVRAGDAVYVVVVTNGDIDGREIGLKREAESVAAARVLDVAEDHVIFMGYGDQTLTQL